MKDLDPAFQGAGQKAYPFPFKVSIIQYFYCFCCDLHFPNDYFLY